MKRNKKSTPVQPPAPEDPKVSRRQALASAVRTIEKRLAEGQLAKPSDLKILAEYDRMIEPPAREETPAPAPNEPADVEFDTLREGAELLGVHPNTVSNWNNQGHKPPGKTPWSLKGYMLVLRRAGRLGQCSPSGRAHAMFAWVMEGAGERAHNPDDPVHSVPMSWEAEGHRQRSLSTLEERRIKAIERETMDGDRIPLQVYRARWRKRAQKVLSAIERFMFLPQAVSSLTPTQRDQLVGAIKERIRAARDEIGGKPAAPGTAARDDDDAE